MKIDECTPENVHTVGDGETPPCAGLTPNVLPEAQSTISAVSSHTGVSTRNVHTGTTLKQQKHEDTPHWYALRCTYGREKVAYDYFVAKGIIAFYPTTNAVKIINGKRKVVAESRLPNIFFAFGTEEQIKTFVYDNVNLPYLRFYYRYFHISKKVEKEPLIVSNNQIESLRIICKADADDIIVSIDEVQKFQKGQAVRILKGNSRGG